MKVLAAGDINLLGALRLALPLVATSFVFCFIGAVDMAIAGWQTAAAQAAVGIADQCIFATMLVGTGLAAATGCFVSQSLGANNMLQARRYSSDGLIYALCTGTLASFICFVGADKLVEFCGCTEATKNIAMPYLQACALGNLPFTVVLVQASILRSMGHTAQCLRLWSLIGVISIAGGLGLFYGNGTVFTNSMTSLAVAWDVGALAGVLMAANALRATMFKQTNMTRVQTHGRNQERVQSQEPGQSQAQAQTQINTQTHTPIQAPELSASERLKNFCDVGIPVLLSEACCLISLAAVYAILGQMPDSEKLQAAYTVTLKIEETFGILPLLALSTVSATLIGHQVGAQRFTQAKKLGWQLTLAAGAAMLFCGSVVRDASPALAAIFTCDASVLREVHIGTISANISLPLIALSSILFANLEGAGQTKHSLLAQFTGYVLCRIPHAHFFGITLGFGYSGIWLAIVISRFAIGIQAIALYQSKFSSYTTVHFVESKRMPNSAK